MASNFGKPLATVTGEQNIYVKPCVCVYYQWFYWSFTIEGNSKERNLMHRAVKIVLFSQDFTVTYKEASHT